MRKIEKIKLSHRKSWRDGYVWQENSSASIEWFWEVDVFPSGFLVNPINYFKLCVLLSRLPFRISVKPVSHFHSTELENSSGAKFCDKVFYCFSIRWVLTLGRRFLFIYYFKLPYWRNFHQTRGKNSNIKLILRLSEMYYYSIFHCGGWASWTWHLI